MLYEEKDLLMRWLKDFFKALEMAVKGHRNKEKTENSILFSDLYGKYFDMNKEDVFSHVGL